MLLTLYALSGAAGLVVEQVLERLLTTVVGASVQAAAVVLAVYFVALSLGAASAGALGRRAGSPLRLYAAAELVAGVTACGVGLGFSQLQVLAASAVQTAGHAGPVMVLVRVGLAAVFVGPPALAMGLTFPAVAAWAERSNDPRRVMTGLYTLNVGGGVAAALAAPYALFPVHGMTGGALVAGGAQIAVGLAALALSRREAPGAPVEAPRAQPRPVPRLVALAFVCGATTFAWEVVWVQLIGITLGTSAYAFAMMLAVVLAGLFVGSVAVLPLSRRLTGRGLTLAGLVLAVVAPAAVYRGWPDAPTSLLDRGISVSSFGQAQVACFAEAAVLVGVPAAALGLVYPSLLRDPDVPAEDASRHAARLGVANAVGSCVGALGCAHVLLPRLGSEGTYRALLVTGVVTAAAVGVHLFSGAASRAAVVVASGFALLGVARLPAWDVLRLTSGLHVYLRPTFVHASSKLLFVHEDSVGGVTTVVENPGRGGPVRYLLTNGKFQGSDAGETAAQAAFGMLPILAAPRRDAALVIGLGTGHTASLFSRAGFARTHVAELAPGIVAAARTHFAGLNHGVLDRPDLTLFLDDGRNHLLRRADARYDVVSIELNSVWFAGATNLYSREFYDLVRRRLTPGGVLQQWVQLHHSSASDFVTVVGTMRAAFPHVAVWFAGGQGVALASEAPLAFPEENVARVLAAPGLKAEIGELDPRALVASPLFGSADVDALVALAPRLGAVVNTDANRYVEYWTPRHNVGDAPTPEALAAQLRAALTGGAR